MNRLIGKYRNGNYDVAIFSDGTKIRSNDLEPLEGQSPDECFVADFPESMDVTITNRCNAGCEMCYAGCTIHGRNADIMNAKWINHLHPFTEMAIGGGNVFEHPDLFPFLKKLKDKRVLANITVNQKHFLEHFDKIQYLANEELVRGVGVSVFDPTEELLEKMAQLPHAVAHCILGVVSLETFEKMADRNMRLLLLGYKTTGRGKAYERMHDEDIKVKISQINSVLPELVKHFKVVSFDNKALQQLDVRRMLTDEEWNRFYMGDDGIEGKTTSATMFIDMVANSYSINSMCQTSFLVREDDTPDSMFQFLRDYSERGGFR